MSRNASPERLHKLTHSSRAFSITAFPVLARILTELKLLRQDVGVTVLAAGVGNDVVGWILLALTVALVNSSTGLTAFYVILLVIAWCLLLFLLVKPAYAWLARRSGSDHGPSDTMMMLTILLVLISAFYTEIIGVHPIFGAFLVGLIIPHENGYAVSLTEKIEDIVSVLFLPLYFASSGLKTNIGLLNDGKSWGYTFAIIICATFSKVVGSMLIARLNGFLWRESLTVGTLMSCKGLVELIVLNVGLSAGILSEKLFTMFVIMALVTTFMTTPLTMWFFPPWYQEKVNKWRSGECDWEGRPLEKSSDNDSEHAALDKLGKVTIVVNRIEGVSSLLRFTHFLARSSINLHLVRIMELTDRLSQIIKVSESEDLLQRDPLISIFKTLTKIVGVRLSYSLQVLAPHEYADTIERHAEKHSSDLIVTTWTRTGEGEWQDNEYITALLEHGRVNVAVLLDHNVDDVPLPRRRTMSMGSILTRTRSECDEIHQLRTIPSRVSQTPMDAEKVHAYLPMFQFGRDEKLGLLLLSQLLSNTGVSASVVFFKCAPIPTTTPATEAHSRKVASKQGTVHFSVSTPISSPDLTRSMSGGSDTFVATAADLSRSASEIAELETYMRSHTNMKLDIVSSSTPLLTAMEHTSVLARDFPKSTITTIVARSTSATVERDLRHADGPGPAPSQLLSSQGTGGEVVEAFIAMKDRSGPIILVQSKF